MSEAKHTPGPWVWRGKDGSLRQKGEPPYAYGQTVLRPDYEYDSGVDTVVSEADARLIAAAPDMLEALRNVQKLISEAAMARFNCKDGDWAERLFFSQQVTSRAIDAATGGGPKPLTTAA